MTSSKLAMAFADALSASIFERQYNRDNYVEKGKS
jgi:hypothetical protein